MGFGSSQLIPGEDKRPTHLDIVLLLGRLHLLAVNRGRLVPSPTARVLPDILLVRVVPLHGGRLRANAAQATRRQVEDQEHDYCGQECDAQECAGICKEEIDRSSEINPGRPFTVK